MHAPLQPGVSIGTVISNAPLYRPAPVFYAAPVYVAAPVHVRPAPVVYAPQPVYRPQHVAYQPVWVHPGHMKAKWKYKHRQHRDWRHDDHDD